MGRQYGMVPKVINLCPHVYQQCLRWYHYVVVRCYSIRYWRTCACIWYPNCALKHQWWEECMFDSCGIQDSHSLWPCLSVSITFHYIWPFFSIDFIANCAICPILTSEIMRWYHRLAENCWIYHLSSVWTHVPLTQIYLWIKQQGSILLLACYSTEQTINSQRGSRGCGSYSSVPLIQNGNRKLCYGLKNCVVLLQVVSQGLGFAGLHHPVRSCL